MATDRLSNPPLTEALLEVRWALLENSNGTQIDNSYPVVAGLLFERVKQDFPHIERLPAAGMPDEITPHVVKQRFRSSPEGWPLMQIGPGVASLNFTTDGYGWQGFRERALSFFRMLQEARQATPAPSLINSVVLKYLNILERPADLLAFFKDKMHTDVRVPFTTDHPEIEGPTAFLMDVEYQIPKTKTKASIRLRTGERNGQPVLGWDLRARSIGPDAPQAVPQFRDWLDAAHDFLRQWFFVFIAGDLEKQFGGGDDNA